MRHVWPATLLILLLLIGFRLLGAVGNLPNFSPLPAVFLCCIIFLRGTKAWVIPLAAWLLSNPLVSWLQGSNPFAEVGAVLTALITLLAIGALALPLRKHARLGVVVGAGIASALLFHTLTGVAAWISYPLYPKNLVGLEQSLWSGPVNSPIPSWVFLRNSLCSNVLFTLAFALASLKWPVRTSSKAVSISQ